MTSENNVFSNSYLCGVLELPLNLALVRFYQVQNVGLVVQNNLNRGSREKPLLFPVTNLYLFFNCVRAHGEKTDELTYLLVESGFQTVIEGSVESGS